MPELVVVGRVERPHGLSGEVSVEPWTDFPERFAPGLRLLWRRGGDERDLMLAGVRPHGRRLLARFEGVADVDSARGLQGGELCVPGAEAFPAPDGFYYAFEIEGFSCEGPEGAFLGRAVGLASTAAGPMLTVETAPGKEALVPFANPIVVRVDREERRIVLDPPEGLLEL